MVPTSGDPVFALLAILLQTVVVFGLIYAIAGVGLFALKVIVNAFAKAISIIWHTAPGKWAAAALFVWLIVTIIRKG